jgi:hypothetical protein
MITPAQLDTLRAVSHHRNAIRVHRSLQSSDWTWQVGGVPRSGTIGRLIDKGLLETTEPDVVVVSEKGRRVLGASCGPGSRPLDGALRSPRLRRFDPSRNGGAL